ncbi:MAG TPA: hypothetical protein VM511_04860 [Luteolibacter sp.]|nr:hypothetical protein [Luteolibacter sp.]
MKPSLFLFIALSALSVQGLRAATLVSYTFGTGAAADFNPTTTAGSIFSSVTAITAGSGVTLESSGVDLGGSGLRAMGVDGPNAVSSTEAFAISTGRFISFTLTPQVGQSFDLGSIAFRANIGGPNTANEFSIQVDTGSGFNTAATGIVTAESGSTGSPRNIFNLALTPPSAGAYTGITTPTTIRMVFYDTTATPATWDAWVRLDDIYLDSTVIPEPGSALLGLLGAGFLIRRRR